MGNAAKISAEVEAWDESTYEELADGRKLTRATVRQALTGDLDGHCVTEYLMFYGPDSTANFIGQKNVVGTLAGRSGAFVVQVRGRFVDGEARSDLTIVPGSATGQLAGLSGEGTAVAPGGCTEGIDLDYALDPGSGRG
jgi:hypothetical protein